MKSRGSKPVQLLRRCSLPTVTPEAPWSKISFFFATKCYNTAETLPTFCRVAEGWPPMADPLQIYDALRRAIATLSMDGRFTVSDRDAADLARLTVEDLRACRYYKTVADEIVAGLSKGDITLLGRSMGVRLTVDPDWPSLLDEAR
jgi:hypothetical protein